MTIDRIVYSVLHGSENVERVISLISPQVTAKNKVGLEVSEEDLRLYDQINARGLSPQNAEKELLDAIIKKYGYDYSGNEEELPNPLSAAIFWSNLYNHLKNSGVEVIGLGSEKRIRLLNHNVDRSYRGAVMYHLIEVLHFDHFLFERILEYNVDRIIVGCGHAKRISKITSSNLILVDELHPRLEQMQEVFEREYRAGQYGTYSLPDLRD